jgi:hypothetical protein
VALTTADVAAGTMAGVTATLMPMLGVDFGVLVAAMCACAIADPINPPEQRRWALAVRYLCSVVVSCAGSDPLASIALTYWPALKGHDHSMQILAAISLGIALHVLVGMVPALGKFAIAKLNAWSTP